MIRSFLLTIAATLVLVGSWSAAPAHAQNQALMDLYGRGVHAYYAGRYTDAFDLLTRAIDNGVQDPRAYYFRGIVANATGRPELAKSDWRAGAELEASGRDNPLIGRSLARIQGYTRLQLEQIRRDAEVQAAQQAAAQSQARYGEIEQAEQRVLQSSPSPQPSDASGTAGTSPANVSPPPAPAENTDDPFADDVGGEPLVESSDALEGAVESARAEAEAANAAAASSADAGGENPFGNAGNGENANPFGAPAGNGNDAFAPAGGGNEDPFAPSGGNEDPFAPSGGNDDPFGGGDDPFSN